MFAPKVARPQTKSAAASSTSNLAHQRLAFVAHRRGYSSTEQALFLQRRIGNQATLRYLTDRLSNSTKQIEQHGPEARQAARGEAPSPSWDFSKIAILPPDRPNQPQALLAFPRPSLPIIIQPKLAIGRVDDPLERQADRIADQVMRMPDPDLSITRAPPQLSRKCSVCEEEEGALQAKPAGLPKVPAREAPHIVHEVLHSPGQPIDTPTRIFMEHRIGRDFTGVRVHNDARRRVVSTRH